MTGTRVVLSVSPHPDDELLGAPASLMALRDAGWHVINLACSLGRPADQERRRAELARACELARFELVIADPPAQIGVDDDLEHAQAQLARAIVEQLERWGAELIVGPSPHDGHHGHEVAGRALVDAAEKHGVELAIMLWALWSELPIPNVLVAFDADRLHEIQRALSAHSGELARNRFDRLLAGRGAASAVLGPERVFGFGRQGEGLEYAELLTEVAWSRGHGWRLTAAHELDPERPIGDPSGPQIGWWLHAASVRDTLGRNSRHAGVQPSGAREAPGIEDQDDATASGDSAPD